jgi:anhydro-N-acetylmuramic acid kinase
LPDLLASLLAEPYFALAAPKSTGRDLFNPDWLAARLANFPSLAPVDVQASLAELTASSCAAGLQRYGAPSKQLIVCGGGAFNGHLMRRLQAHLPGVQVSSSQAHGLPPLQVEAAAFAWLARQAVLRQTGSLEKVTGARGARILGAIYPA